MGRRRSKEGVESTIIRVGRGISGIVGIVGIRAKVGGIDKLAGFRRLWGALLKGKGGRRAATAGVVHVVGGFMGEWGFMVGCGSIRVVVVFVRVGVEVDVGF